MYSLITKEGLEHLGNSGYINMNELPDESISYFKGCYSIHSRVNPKMFKDLFNVTFQMTTNSLVFSDMEYCDKPRDRHEYEKFLLATLMHMEKTTKKLNLNKLFVQSKNPWIIEGFYERDFDIINIESENEITIYSALKKMKENDEDC